MNSGYTDRVINTDCVKGMSDLVSEGFLLT